MKLDAGLELMKRYKFDFEAVASNVRVDLKQHKLYLVEEKVPRAYIEDMNNNRDMVDYAQNGFASAEQIMQGKGIERKHKVRIQSQNFKVADIGLQAQQQHQMSPEYMQNS